MKTTCESCGKKIDDNTAASTEEGLLFCAACTKTMTTVCSICGESSSMWEMTSTSQDEIYCAHCATAIA